MSRNQYKGDRVMDTALGTMAQLGLVSCLICGVFCWLYPEYNPPLTILSAISPPTLLGIGLGGLSIRFGGS